MRSFDNVEKAFHELQERIAIADGFEVEAISYEVLNFKLKFDTFYREFLSIN